MEQECRREWERRISYSHHIIHEWTVQNFRSMGFDPSQMLPLEPSPEWRMPDREGWRILKTPLSLLSRVLQAKYFPQESSSSATLGQRSSYIWRSMLTARPHLLKGISFEHNLKVSGLTDFEQGFWKQELIRAHFNSREAEEIFKVPLCDDWPKDEQIWAYEKAGKFSVRSAYCLSFRKRI
ncbi:hypothetical protein M9H77_14502 [Catharanthus roseus]|uniref:Uncharacterized protein n=1 Tax=Catharanthus roseus TaxID=4058 RepID=A0ACC0BNC8_CATRO|nr:hypothetical protein M9H77_14502 [Catharanthus roseus]